jgi:hypothetical protein
VRELTIYMSEFTRPLIHEIYGAHDISMPSFEDIVNYFASLMNKKHGRSEGRWPIGSASA